MVTLWATKNGKPRSIPMNERVQEVMGRRRLRPSNRRGPFDTLTPNVLKNVWAKVRSSMGLEGDKQFVPHVFRHTFCSRLVMAGVDPATIKALAGHSDFRTTLQYVHLDKGHLTDAIAPLE